MGDVLELTRTQIVPDLATSYRQIGVYSWGKGIIENDPLTGAELSKVSYYKFPPHALILSNIQAWEAAIAVSKCVHAEFIASQRFLPYLPKSEGEVDVRYLLHFFLSDSGLALIRQASPGTVTRNRTLGIKAFEDLVIPLPDLAEQNAVARRLDKFAAASSFVLSEERRVRHSERALRDRLLAECGPADRVKLGSLIHQDEKGVKVHPDTTYPNVGVLNRGRGLFKKEDVRGSETAYSTLYPLRTGQLVYSKLFAWEGSVAVVPSTFNDHFVSSEFPHFDVDDHCVSLRYLGHMVRSTDFCQQLSNAGTGMGQRRQRVNVDRFTDLTIPLPARDVQEDVAGKLDLLDRVAELRASRLDIAKAIPQAARNAAFSGV
jgi:type I restriction enzyme S subunit